MGFGDGSGITRTICKQFAPRSRQITKPDHSIFTGRLLLLTPNQQCQSTEGSEYGMEKLGGFCEKKKRA